VAPVFWSFVWSLALASSQTSSLSEELLGDCGASSPSAVLLQVDRKQVRGEDIQTHPATGEFAATPRLHEEAAIPLVLHDRGSDSHKHWTISSDDHEEPVTMKELLRHTEPLQDQIDDVQSDVKQLRSDFHKHTQQRTHSLSNDDSGGHKHASDDDDEEEGEEHDSEGRGNWGPGNSNNNDEEDDGSGSEEENDSGTQKHTSADDYEKANDDDWAWSDQESKGNEEASGSHEHAKHDQPDWEGVAPRAWNGLEDVNAKDHGPDASWKGDGVGVSSGEKYSGDDPYETLMDVDYLIDSNPEPTGKPRDPTPEPKGDESRRRRTPGKSSPTNGGRRPPSRPPSRPKVSPKAPSKSGRKSPSSGTTKAPSQAKTAPKGGRKDKSPSSSNSPARTGPKEEGKSKASGSKSAKSRSSDS